MKRNRWKTGMKRIAGCLMAFAMAVTGLPIENDIQTYADDDTGIVEETAEVDSHVYMLAGGSAPAGWDPCAAENQMKESDLEGVYEITLTRSEGVNEFKILRHDDESYGNGWAEQLLLGTTVYADNKSQMCIEVTEETEATVYLHPESGAVVILDEQGNAIDYTFRWITSFEDGTGEFLTASEFLTCGVTWSADSVGVSYLPDIQAKNDALLDYIKNGTPINKDEQTGTPIVPDDTGNADDTEEEPVGGNVIRFHFQNGKNWEEVGGYIFQSIAWITNVTDNSVVTVKKSDGTIKKLWPGARCTEEKENWYTCTATFTDTVLTDGMVFKFNNLVGDATTNSTTEQEDIDAILASGIKTTAEAEQEETESIIINKKNPILADGTIPTDLYIEYDGKVASVTEYPPQSYLDANELPNKYVDGVLYNGMQNELIAYPSAKQGILTVPETVSFIRDNAFKESKGLTGIIISKNTDFNVYYEEEGVVNGRIFEDCDNLQFISVDSDNSNFKSDCGVLYNADGTKLLVFPNGMTGSYQVMDGTESIGKYAFKNCKNCKILIPDSVTEIDEEAFEGCEELKIYGTIGSAAQKYAYKHNIPFVDTNMGSQVTVTFHFQNGMNWDEVGGYIHQGIDWSNNVTDNTYITVNKSDGTIKKLWPGARCEEEVEGWYTCTATFTEDVLKSGMAFMFNNFVADAEVSQTLDQEDLDAILASGIKTSEDEVKESTPSIIINKKNTILSFAVPTDLYIEYDGVNVNVTDIAPESYRKASGETDKYIDGVLYNWDETELIRYPVDKAGDFTVPETVTFIRDGAFQGCKELTGITISENTKFNLYSDNEKTEENAMFNGCSKLKYVEIKEAHSEYKTIDGVLFDKTGKELLFYPEAKGNVYTIPETVETMENFIFVTHDNMKLYGMKDSYTETYAEQNEIEFYPLNEKVGSDAVSSSECEISVLYGEKQIDENVSLSVRNMEKEEIVIEDKIKHQNVTKEDAKYVAYDISLRDEENNKVQPDGTIIVKIKCPDGFDGMNCKVYYLDDDGKVVDMQAYYQDGYLFFSTNHFSTYVVSETELKTDGKKEEVIVGDVNGDGMVDIKDSALLKRYLAGWEVEMNLQAADVDGDGEVTIKDSAIVKRTLAGWE